MKRSIQQRRIPGLRDRRDGLYGSWSTISVGILALALAGCSEPYQGQKVRYIPGVRNGVAMVSGNPIHYDESFMEGGVGHENVLESADHRFSVWGFVHELGHNFSWLNEGLYMIGDGPIEAWANIFTVHVLETLGHPEAKRDVCAGATRHKATGTYSTFRNDPWLPLCMLLELKDSYGWSMFQEFFRSYATLDPRVVPQLGEPESERWSWLRDFFNELTDEDTTEIFESYHIPLR